MAKCSVCNSRKGKRRCKIVDDLICSQCCGNTRTNEFCSECTHYQKPKRKYNEVPSYSVSEMDGNLDIQSYGNTIEGALCAYDLECDKNIRDSDAIRIIELLIDKYYYNDQEVDCEDEIIITGLKYIDNIIIEDLKDVDNENIVKVLGVLRFVANRRTRIGREYMNIIHQYVGPRIGTDIRVLSR